MLWFEGRLHAGTRAPFDLADRGLTLGDGVFDTALALRGRIAFEAAHVRRLVAAAGAIGLAIDPDRVREAMRAVAATGPRLAVRTTLTRGPGPRGLAPPEAPRPSLFATAAAADPAIAFAPIRLWPTGMARNETSPTARLKTLGYLDAVLAAREARAAGFDDALFRNTRGRVGCAGTGNLFALAAGRLVTPALSEGVLDGIVRGAILRLAPALGLPVEERALPLAELHGAEAVFLTNSLRLLAPVAAIGETAFASAGHPALGRLAAALRAEVADTCGVAGEAVG